MQRSASTVCTSVCKYVALLPSHFIHCMCCMDINGNAWYNGQPNDGGTHRKIELIEFTPLVTPISCFASSFATMHFDLAGCEGYIPSFSAPNVAGCQISRI